jgi:hypothetical protein
MLDKGTAMSRLMTRTEGRGKKGFQYVYGTACSSLRQAKLLLAINVGDRSAVVAYFTVEQFLCHDVPSNRCGSVDRV